MVIYQYMLHYYIVVCVIKDVTLLLLKAAR